MLSYNLLYKYIITVFTVMINKSQVSTLKLKKGVSTMWIIIVIVITAVLLYYVGNYEKNKEEKERRRYYESMGKPVPPPPEPVADISKRKRCPYCNSPDWQYAGEDIIGARAAKTKTQHSLNLNPLKPFTILDSKEKVIRKAKPGFSVDEFICLNCGRRFR